MNAWHTELSQEALASLPAGAHTFLTPSEVASLIADPLGERPRIYGYIERGVYAGQIVSIPSAYYLNMYRDTLGAVWASGVTVADLVRRA